MNRGNLLDPILGQKLTRNGVALPRSKTELGSGISVVDDPGNGRQILVAAGSSAAPPVADVAALRSLTPSTGDVVDGQSRSVLGDPVPWTYSAADGAAFVDDGSTVVKPNEILTANPGRWYRATSAPVLPTWAALGLAVSGKHAAIHLQAYATLGDGAGGDFDYDPSDTTTADNGGTVRVAGTKRLKRRYSGEINLRWFGAKGNGTTDDTAAINAWLAAIPPGGRGYVPAGVYRHASPISFAPASSAAAPVTLRGDGIHSIFLADVGTSADGFVLGSESAFTFGLSVQDMCFVSQASVRDCLRLNNLVHSKFSNVHAIGGSRVAGRDVYLYGCLVCDLDLVISANAVYPGLPSPGTNPGASDQYLLYLGNAQADDVDLSPCNANRIHVIAEGGSGAAVYQADQAGSGDNAFSGTVEGIAGVTTDPGIEIHNSTSWHISNCHLESNGGISIVGGNGGVIGHGVQQTTIAISGAINVSVGTSNGGVLYAQGVVGLPDTIESNAYWAGSDGAGNSGRMYIGDGGGSAFRIAKRNAGVTTDLMALHDSGYIEAVNFQSNTNQLGGIFGGPQIFAGSADPSGGGGFAAALGSLYFRNTGGYGTTVYAKEGAGNTDWAAMVSYKPGGYVQAVNFQSSTNQLGGFVGGPQIFSGSADPTGGGGFAAAIGSLYLRTTGGTGTTLYVKEGAGDTAWVGK